VTRIAIASFAKMIGKDRNTSVQEKKYQYNTYLNHILHATF